MTETRRKASHSPIYTHDRPGKELEGGYRGYRFWLRRKNLSVVQCWLQFEDQEPISYSQVRSRATLPRFVRRRVMPAIDKTV